MQSFKQLLTKENIQALKTSTNFHQHELSIQNLLNQFFLTHFQNIPEERNKKIKEFQEHGMLIKQDLKNAIREFNRNIFKKLTTEGFPEDYLVEKATEDFIKKYDKCKDNVEIYKLLFHLEEKKTTIKYKDKIKELKYQVLDLKNFKKNKSRLVKEKKLQKYGIIEYADFAFYISGIPIIIIEVKTQKTGLSEALKDQQTKETYKYTPILLGTNGTDAFLNSSYKSDTYFKWKNYGDNGEITNIGIYDLAKELLFDIENMMFYLYANIFIKEKNQKNILRNNRVQQYFLAKKIKRKFDIAQQEEKNFKPMNYYFMHTTRSGKTTSFLTIAAMVFRDYRSLFTRIIFFTHDVSSVQSSVLKDFGQEKFDGSPMIRIESKKDYIGKLLKTKQRGVFIVNMQKIDKLSDIVVKDKNVLIMIDEIHTHQTGLYAEIRKKQFPNASYIGATATPSLSRQNKKQIKENFFIDKKRIPTEKEIENIWLNHIIDETSKIFGERIDTFNSVVAQDLGIVLPLNIIKVEYTIKTNIEFEKLEDKLNEKLEEKFLNTQIIYEYLDKVITWHKNKTDKKELSEYETFRRNPGLSIQTQNEILNNLYEKLNEEFQIFKKKNKAKIKTELKREFRNIMFPEKLSRVIKYINIAQKTSTFTPKFFWAVDTIEDAVSILMSIKNHIEYDESLTEEEKKYNKKQNIYKNIRFAVDTSEIKGISMEERIELIDLYGEDFQDTDINGKLLFKNKTEVIDDFEAEGEGAIDVLLIVNKRLMGYDNPNLAITFLDKYIEDIKLATQLVTRSTTVKNDSKKTGILVDLTIGETNIESIKEAFALYNNTTVKEAFISQELIETTYQQIENIFNYIKTILMIKTGKESFKEYAFEYAKELKSLYNKEDPLINNFYKAMKELNKVSKNLLNYEFQMRKDEKYFLLDEYNYLAKINKELYQHILERKEVLGESEHVTFTKESIKEIIEEVLEYCNIDNKKPQSIKDLIHVKGKGETKREISQKVKLENTYSRVRKKLKILKQDKRMEEVAFGFFIKLQELADKNNLTEKELDNVEEEMQKIKRDILKDIKNEYENNITYYIIDGYLQNLYSSKKYEGKIKLLSKKIALKTDKYILENRGDSNREAKINKILKSLNLESLGWLKDIIDKDIEEEKNWARNEYRKLSNNKEEFKKILGMVLDKNEIYG